MSLDRDVGYFARKLDAALSRDRVSFAELFTDAFMRERTSYPTFLAMSGAAGATTADELRAVPHNVWEKHVIASTSFASWEEMQKEAFGAWLKQQVDEPLAVTPSS